MTLLLNSVLIAFAFLFLIDFSNMLQFAWKDAAKKDVVSVINKQEIAVSLPQPEVIEDPWQELYTVVDEVSKVLATAKREEIKMFPLLPAVKPELIPQTSGRKLTKTQINKLCREELMQELKAFDIQPVGSLKDLRFTLKRRLMLE